MVITCPLCKATYYRSELVAYKYCPVCYYPIIIKGSKRKKDMTLITKCKRCGVEINLEGMCAGDLEHQVRLCPACTNYSIDVCGLASEDLLGVDYSLNNSTISTTNTAITVIEGYKSKTKASCSYLGRELMLLNQLRELGRKNHAKKSV